MSKFDKFARGSEYYFKNATTEDSYRNFLNQYVLFIDISTQYLFYEMCKDESLVDFQHLFTDYKDQDNRYRRLDDFTIVITLFENEEYELMLKLINTYFALKLKKDHIRNFIFRDMIAIDKIYNICFK